MIKIVNAFKNLISLFYPYSCVACGNVLQQNEQSLCVNCLLHLPETNYHLEKENPLQLIFRGRVPIENISAFLFYKKVNQVQRILHSLKYNGNQEIGEFLGYYYGQQLIQQPDYQSIDCVIPIPLHYKKLKLRGYNQSEAIAKGLGKAMKIPVYTDVLIRNTYTDTQTKKSRFSRWKNVEHVFEVQNAEPIFNKHVLICDDVLTTGATLEAGISKLLENNISKISVVTLAVAH